MSHTFFLCVTLVNCGIPGIMCPTVIGAPGSYALQIGEVQTVVTQKKEWGENMVLVKFLCLQGGMCIVRWWIYFFHLTLTLRDDPI